ncbi:MAG TPA: S41 family peptidase [archaeon]|nr:S41 family peptidase [archaeon]
MYGSNRDPSKYFICWFALVVIVLSFFVYHRAAAQDEELFGEVNKQEAIRIVVGFLNDNYVFPDSGEIIGAELLKRYKDGRYASKMTAEKFARMIDSELEEISRDKHLALFLDPAMNRGLREEQDEDNYPDEDMLEEERRNNYGFKQAVILEGNVGYLDLRIFFEPKSAAPSAVAAMGFLANCDALIIDLRNNGGGWGEMVAFLSSYFFSADSLIQLSSVYSRPDNKTYQSWTAPYVPGKRLITTPVYILVSKSTFSAAEEFCYNLKHLGRATLVGETTRGGAHPISYKPVGEKFVLMIPEMTSINPVTGSNWEGVGVEPHIKTSSDKALEVAHLMALEELKKCEDRKKAAWYQWHIEGLEAKNSPIELPEDITNSYIGKYGSMDITLEGGDLFYCRGGRMKHKLSPMSRVLFAIKGLENFRLKFIVEQNEVRELEVLYDDGRVAKYRKEK